MNARQGHRYDHAGAEVLALSSGERPSVARIDKSKCWPLGLPFAVDAADLVPLPMVYFHGQVPA